VAERTIVRVDTIAARYAQLDGDRRLAASITSAFGLLAMAIATAGIYGVMAFLVAGRSREIGVRMALGADAAAVRRLVLRSALAAVLAGSIAGVAAALGLSRVIDAQLYGLTATDPATYLTVGALVILTAVLATWIPARRAARIDPAITLRGE
jgi:ABC-type antimicrobial peptide transport system permease subunit